MPHEFDRPHGSTNERTYSRECRSGWAFSDTPEWIAAQHRRILAHELRQRELRDAPPEVRSRVVQGVTVVRRRA